MFPSRRLAMSSDSYLRQVNSGDYENKINLSANNDDGKIEIIVRT